MFEREAERGQFVQAGTDNRQRRFLGLDFMLGLKAGEYAGRIERPFLDRCKDGEQIGRQDMRLARWPVVKQVQAVDRAPNGVTTKVRNVDGPRNNRQAIRRAAIEAKQVKPGVPRCIFLIYSTCALNASGLKGWPSVVVMFGRDIVLISSPR